MGAAPIGIGRLLKRAGEGAEFGVDEEPMEHAVAAGAFAGLGGRELSLNFGQHRRLRRRQLAFRRNKIGEPCGVG